MTERLITDIVTHLRTAYPGIVEEWEWQREDSPEWGFPAFDTLPGLGWWLRSEADLAASFREHDETGVEQALGAYCLAAAQRVHDAAYRREDNT